MRSLNRCNSPANILLIADETAENDAIRQLLESSLSECTGAHYELTYTGTIAEASAMLAQVAADLIVVDLATCVDQVEAQITRLAKRSNGALIVALSDSAAVSDAMAAMRAGAHEYVTKPLNGSALTGRIRELTDRHGRRGAVRLSPNQTEVPGGFHGLTGTSPQMRVVIEQIGRIASSDAPVFITGESGTGKSLCAEALHAAGPRADFPLIELDCGAVHRDLIDAELFGVARGGTSDARTDRPGAVEQANGGTLLLDEVDALDLSQQTQLMRLLETKTICRRGESTARQVDVRIVATTRSNPVQLLSSRRMREDLFYRLHVLPIHMPPLRQRPSDIAPLASYFLAEAATKASKHFEGFSPSAVTLLNAHEFPGNVRQLHNLMERVAVLFDGGIVSDTMLLESDMERLETDCNLDVAEQSEPAILPMWRQEQNIIEATISHFDGNISKAAMALEISASTIYRKRLAWAELENCQSGAA